MATSDASIPSGRIEAVLWDLDGVIVDSGPYHFEAFRRLFAELRRELSQDEFFGRLIGLRNDAILRIVLGDVAPEEAKRLSAQKEETFRELVAGNVGGAARRPRDD